jgi:tetratricopeptide (TPR) repeat protein
MADQERSLITSLQQTFPEPSWSWVIPALRSHPLIWEELSQPEFFKTVRKQLGSQPENWTPSRIALSALEGYLSFEIPYPLTGFHTLPPELSEMVFEKFHGSSSDSSELSSLANAALTGLGLWGESGSGKSWGEILSDQLDPRDEALILSVLSDLVENQIDILEILPPDTAFQILFSYPKDPETRQETLLNLLKKFKPEQALEWLKSLLLTLPKIAAELATALLQDRSNQPKDTQQALIVAELYQIAGDNQSSLKYLKKAENLNQQLIRKLSTDHNTVSVSVSPPRESDPHWISFLELTQDPEAVQEQSNNIAQVLFSLGKFGHLEAAEQIIENFGGNLPESPHLLTAMAAISLQKDALSSGAKFAQLALEKSQESGDYPTVLPGFLLEAGLFEECIAAANQVLNNHPNDSAALQAKSSALSRIGSYQEAANQARLLTILEPKNISLQRKLAGYLENSGEWDEALNIRSSILTRIQDQIQEKSPLGNHLPAGELLSFSECAYQGQHYQRSASAARQVLNHNPQNGLAHAALGKALTAQQKQADAYHHLEKAVQFAPEVEETWLAMADHQDRIGESAEAVKTLLRGSNSARTQAQIFCTLGQLQSENQSYSRALEAFQKAADRIPSEDVDARTAGEIICQLGETYFHLGHLEKARKTLRELQSRYPGYQKGSFVYGQVLLDLDEPQAALPYLARAIESEPGDENPYVYYEDAQLRIGKNHDAARAALEKAIEINPHHPKATALLGEAEAVSGRKEEALESFQRALETPLRTDPYWGPRITLGLGKTALELGQVDTALATLKEGYEKDPDHIGLIQGLAEAYRSANLLGDARGLLTKTLEDFSEDTEILDWLTNFSLEIELPNLAVQALESLIKNNPQDHANYLRLGKSHLEAGNKQQAIGSFTSLSGIDDVNPELLLESGSSLINLGEIETGLKSLSKAALICESNPDCGTLLGRIYSRQAEAYHLNGETSRALDLLDQAIEIDLNDPTWRIQKANLLLESEQHQAARASLKNALDLSPENPVLHLKIAEVLKRLSQYQEALFHSKEALAGFQTEGKTKEIVQAGTLAADLAAGAMQASEAKEILTAITPEIESHSDNKNLDQDLVSALCLKAELDIDTGDEIEAAHLCNQLVSSSGDHPRVQALQARILAVQGGSEESRKTLEKAVNSHQAKQYNQIKFQTAVETALGSAALQVQNWDEAIRHYQHALQKSPRELRSLTNLLQSLIGRAEAHRFSGALQVTKRAPGSEAVSAQAWKQCQSILETLQELEYDPGRTAQLEKLGRAVFTPNLESAQALQTSAADPNEKAVLIGAFRSCRQFNLAAEVALDQQKNLGKYSYLDAQIALALLKIKPEIAAEAAASALENARETDPLNIPMYIVLLAMVEHQQNRPAAALKQIQNALEVWDDEPRWQSLAAAITPDRDQAAAYYRKAIQLEPKFAGHHFSLGSTLLSSNQPDQAAAALEKALEINPEYLEAWLALAECYTALEKLPDARACAAKALDLAPDHFSGRKTMARIAYLQRDYPGAENQLIGVLGQDPNDIEAISLLAKTLSAEHQPDQALKLIEKAVHLDQGNLDLELQKIDLIQQVEGYHAAIDALRLVSSKYPDQYPVAVTLVKTLAEAGETDQAIRTAQEILHNGELSHTRDQKAELHLIAGRLLRNTGQLDQAVHHLHQAKNINGYAYQAALELGRAHYNRRQYEQALKQIQNAIKTSPDEADGYYLAGKVLKELKKYDQAEKMLRRAAKLAPNDLKIHRQLGVLVTLNLVHGDSTRKEYV